MEVRTDDCIYNRFANMKIESVPPEDERDCIGMVLFKPDATESLLDRLILEYIKRELEKKTGQVVEPFALRVVKVEPEDAKALYPEEKNKGYLKYIQDHFGAGYLVAALIVAKNAPEELNKLKGSVRTGQGVRGAFGQVKPIDEETLKNWRDNKLNDKETKRISRELFAANLLHVPDDREGTLRAIELLYPQGEIDNMRSSIPIFDKWFTKDEGEQT